MSSDDDLGGETFFNPRAHRPQRSIGALLALGLILAMGSARALPPGADGSPLTIPVSGIYDAAQGVALNPDGSVVLAGSAGGGQTALARVTAGGALDLGFGTNGIVLHDLSVNLSESLRAIVRMDDGRYVACGTFFSVGTATDFVLVRYNADGSLDGTFDGVGYAVTSFLQSGPGGSLFDQCNAVALQADGMIVSAGYTAENGAPHVALTRHTASGALDAGFGSGGKLDINAALSVNGSSEAHAVAIQPDGKILVGGYASGAGNSEFLLLRLNANGTPDNGFGSSGIVRTPVGPGEDIANAMVLQPDGRIVLAGSAIVADGRRDFALARYTTTGTLDATFGSGGLVTTPVGPSDDIAYALALMPWGRLVAAGSARISTGGPGNDLALVAYNANGTLDHYFGDAGKRMVSVSLFDDVVFALASDMIHPRLWAVGTAQPTTNQDFLAIEFGLPDTIFRNGFENGEVP